MNAYSKALRLGALAVMTIVFVLATFIAVQDQGGWCPTGTNPTDCVQMNAPLHDGMLYPKG